MGDAQATFGIKLDVEGAGGAEDAAKSLANLKASIEADRASLREMTNAMRSLQGASSVSISTFKNLRDAIAAKRVAIGEASGKLAGMKGAFEALPKEVGPKLDAGNLEDYLRTVKGSAGPMGG